MQRSHNNAWTSGFVQQAIKNIPATLLCMEQIIN